MEDVSLGQLRSWRQPALAKGSGYQHEPKGKVGQPCPPAETSSCHERDRGELLNRPKSL